MSTGSTLGDACSRFLQRGQKRAQAAPPGNLLVAMRDPSKTAETLAVFRSVALGLRQVADDLLYASYPSHDEAQAVANDLSSILREYDRGLLSQTFNPDWLADFESSQHHGVDHVSADHRFQMARLSDYLAERTTRNQEMSQYLAQCDATRQTCACMDRSQFVDGLGRFLFTRFPGWQDREQAADFTDAVASRLRDETRGAGLQFRDMELWPLTSIMADKARALRDYSNHYRATSDAEKLLKTDPQAQATWKRCSRAVLAVLETSGLNIDFSGARATNPDTSGLVRMGDDIVRDLPSRLSVEYMKHRREDQGDRHINQFAGALSCYFLEVLAQQQSAALEQELRRVSREMDEVDYFQALPSVVRQALATPSLLDGATRGPKLEPLASDTGRNMGF